MMMANRLALPVAAIAVVGCGMLMLPMVPACVHLGPCAVHAADAERWGVVTRNAFLLLAVTALFIWSLRMVNLALKTNRLIRQLVLQHWPDELRAAVGRTGVSRVTCVDTSTDMVFCAGILSPRIFVSRALVERLGPLELDAILFHEQHHSRRRDPLRYATLTSLKDVSFFLPVLTWIADHQRVNAELAADRAAIRAVGPAPVARALLTLGAPTDPAPVASFVGSAELRIAQLLGDALPFSPGPDRAAWLASAVGTFSLLAVLGCAGQIMLLH